MSEINRNDQRKPQRQAAQQPQRADATRPQSREMSPEARATRPTRRRAVERPTSGDQQVERRPRRVAAQERQVVEGRPARRAAAPGETMQMPQQRRDVPAGQRQRRASVEGAEQQRPARRSTDGTRPARQGQTAGQPSRRQARPAGAQPERRNPRRAARPEGQAPRREARPVTTSKQSVIADGNDGFAIENINPAHRAQVARWREWTTRAFAGVLALGLVIGLLFFARPTTSEIEKRTLTPFPAFTIEGVLDGSFFADVSTWYADTYPLREPLVSLDQWLEGFFGIQTGTMMVGGTTASDDIPDAGKENAGAASAEAAANRVVEAPSTEAMSEEIQNSIMDGLYIKDGAAFSRYYFVQESAETYASAMNLAAERLDGTTKVYSILIPNNSGAMLSESELAQLGGADQKKAIEYFYSLYSNKVTSIDTYDTLRSHNSEYLYFRTDHHWTTQGAFYIYENLCSKMGKSPIGLDSRKSITFQPFLGTFYAQLGLDSMAANPDSVIAYYPNGTNDMTFWTEDGEEVPYQVITDVSAWGEGSGYGAFIGGDKPLSIIENPSITDGSSCVFVKDSYGCAFAPFLVDHYQTVYIIDFRYYEGNIVDFCKEKGVNDLIFLNNITMATASSVGEAILSEVQ